MDPFSQRSMDSFELGRRLRAARGERNQKDVSAMAGVDDSSYGYWESGKSAIRAIDLVKVCRALNVPITAVLGLEDSEEGMPHEIEVQLSRLRKTIVRLHQMAGDVQPTVIDQISQLLDGWVRSIKHAERRWRSGGGGGAAMQQPAPMQAPGGVPVEMKEEILSRPGRKRGRPSKIR